MSAKGASQRRATSDGDTPLNALQRVHRARMIASERAHTDRRGRHRPVSWAIIGQRHGVSERQAERIHRDFCQWEQEREDPLQIIAKALDLREVVMERLSTLGETADNSSAQVGAMRALIDIDHERLELLQSIGKLPKNMARFRGEAEFSAIVREMLEVLERASVPRDVLEQMKGVAERHLNTPIIQENVTHISAAKRATQ